MSRQQRSEQAVADIATRFIAAAQEHLGITPSDLWRVLGYANASTVQSVRRGKSLPDFVRIAEHYSSMRDQHARSLNLHWVITGEGNPMVETQSKQPQHGRTTLKKNADEEDDIIIRIRRMKPTKRATLMKFLREFS